MPRLRIPVPRAAPRPTVRRNWRGPEGQPSLASSRTEVVTVPEGSSSQGMELVGDELIALAVNAPDPARISRIFLDLGAKPVDVHVNCPGWTTRRGAPNLFE